MYNVYKHSNIITVISRLILNSKSLLTISYILLQSSGTVQLYVSYAEHLILSHTHFQFQSGKKYFIHIIAICVIIKHMCC